MNASTVTTVGRTITIEGGAVVWIAEGGGHVHERKNKCRIVWSNGTGRLVRLCFTDWPDGDGAVGDALWPFTKVGTTGTASYTPGEARVYLAPAATFDGTIVCGGLLVVKYDVAVMEGTSPEAPGVPDSRIKALDPLIIVER